MFKEFASHRFAPYAVAALLIIVFIAQSLSTASQKSNTWDEPAHILAGHAYLEKGMDSLSPLHHPAFGRLLTALFPTLLLDLDLDPDVKPEGAEDSNFFAYSVEFLYGNNVDGSKVLFLARCANILVGALLGVYVFVWSRRLWGLGGGALALLFYSLSPNMIAHSSLATTDIAVTAFLFISAYYLYRLVSDAPSYSMAVAAGLAAALALTSKHTALLLVPVAVVCLVIGLRRGPAPKTIACYALLVATAWVVIWAVYAFRYHAIGPNYFPLDWEIFSGAKLAPLFDFLRYLRLLPEAYLYGLEGVLAGAGSGRSAFLFGMYSSSGWWYYFLAAFLIKTPVPTLLFIAAALVYLSRDKEGRTKALFPLLVAAAFFVAFSAQKVNIGLRHVLPAYPFLFVLIGYVARIRTASMRVAAGAFALVCLYYVWSAASIHPHQLAYFNEFVGGPKNGYKYLVDSNLDWGQDLGGLKRYMTEKNIERIKLAYFGLADPAYFDIEYDYLPSYMITGTRNVAADVSLEGWFAVSATMLQGVYLPDRDFYRIFRETEPVDTIGYSIFIYRFD